VYNDQEIGGKLFGKDGEREVHLQVNVEGKGLPLLSRKEDIETLRKIIERTSPDSGSTDPYVAFYSG
jgi:hypothetical protein